MKYAALIVETRETPFMSKILFEHMSKLPPEFSLYVFYGYANKAYMQEEVRRFDKMMKLAFGKTFVSEYDFHMINIEANDFFVKDQASYNQLLTSEWFWDQVNADQVLVFQPDSKILTKDRNYIYNYVDYNYVGAPFPFQPHGGNGGLSWRTVWFMKKVIRDYPYLPSYGNEDVYFSNIMHENKYGLAPEQICRSFAVESMFQLGTFGCHDVQRYLTPEQCEEIYNQYG